ncbi:MAG: phosphatidylserine decarboxylase [Candidatus Accumulibacter sp.]|nr:phosphatidylserine decarboxylase [Accumulibacter sp.]
MFDRLAVQAQYLLPKKSLTVLAGRFAAQPRGTLTTRVIRWFIRRYAVDMGEAAQPDPAAYATFNDFFTRSLRPDARPLANSDFLCPVDGAISQCGHIDRDQIFQAKGHRYSTQALLGGDRQLASHFDDGEFATLYLSPRDYHRIHMPADGHLQRMIHVPGELFSVNPATACGVPGLFARNERVICVFQADEGLFVMALIGATIVGSMATVWHGVVNPSHSGQLSEWRYDSQQIILGKGQEMGRFLLGSTVVMLFPKATVCFDAAWQPGKAVRMGETMAERKH